MARHFTKENKRRGFHLRGGDIQRQQKEKGQSSGEKTDNQAVSFR